MTKNKSVPIWIVRGKQYGVLKIKLVGTYKISDINSNFKMIYLTLVEHKTPYNAFIFFSFYNESIGNLTL